MAENEASMVHKADSESSGPLNPLFSIVSKFTQVFNFPFPPPPARIDVRTDETARKVAGDEVVRGSEVAEESNPVSVKFTDDPTTAVAPLKLEAEEVEKNSNPVVLWQVYAIGGFFILRWVWGRWNKHNANKKSSNEDTPPPPPPPATEANE